MSNHTQALIYAAQAHDGQFRKGTRIPYITHPVAVSALVMRHGGSKAQGMAALLHDVLEDCGQHHEGPIREQFGERMLTLVQGCTDGVPDAVTGKKLPWRTRKEIYLEHLLKADDELLLVSGCDKLHNAMSIFEDLNEVGMAVFDRFTGRVDGTLWYYDSLAAIFTHRKTEMARALSNVVTDIHTFVDLEQESHARRVSANPILG